MKATNTNSSFSYLIIGSGRVARHLSHYFHLLNINFASWNRVEDPHALARKLQSATHVLLAISDSALEGFFRQYLAGYDLMVVHFSGAHHFNGMVSAHPLMTFGSELYALEFYKKIHFTMTGATLNEALPGLGNPSSIIPASEKARYHAHCVMGGNFVTLLLAKMLSEFKDLKIPPEAAQAYIEKVVANTLHQTNTALTGPLVRKDIATVMANLNALENDPYQKIYEAFLKTHWPEYPRK